MAIKRAVSVAQILNKKFCDMPFDGVFSDSFGLPERSGVWLIWGESGNGKTRFTMQLAKYLCQFGKVAYNTLEEGASKSLQRTIKDEQMQEVSSQFILLDREPIEELKERLRMRKSPDIVLIDSFQYTGLSKKEYKELKEEFKSKLFIFISHAEGKLPEGRPAKFVRYDADIKIFIEGFKAFPISRFGGGEPYIIWEEGARRYWGEKSN